MRTVVYGFANRTVPSMRKRNISHDDERHSIIRTLEHVRKGGTPKRGALPRAADQFVGETGGLGAIRHARGLR